MTKRPKKEIKQKENKKESKRLTASIIATPVDPKKIEFVKKPK